MRRILAVGVVDSWEGGWQLVQGNERAAVASPIGDGEDVWLEGEGDDICDVIKLSPVPIILDVTLWRRYRVIKDGSRAMRKLPTTVEMILNGSAPTSHD